MLTAPLTGARYPEPTDGPLGALQIGYAVADLEDNTLPRFATTGARDTAYAAWVAAGGTMAAGLYCTVAGRLMRHTGAAWEYVPGYRGGGTTFPTGAVEGDTYRHDTYRCTMRYRSGSWVQADLARVDNDADRVTFLAALNTAGLLMHGGFMVRQNDVDRLYWADTNTTLAPVASYRGSGSSFPSAPREGDTFAHTLYRCMMVRRANAWWQASITQIASATDRAAFITALTQAGGAVMHAGFQVYQTDADILWVSTGGAGESLEPTYPRETGDVDMNLTAGWTPVVSTLRRTGNWASFTVHATRASWSAGAVLHTFATNERPSSDKYFVGIYQGRTVEVAVSTSTGEMTVNTAGTGGVVVSGSWPVLTF